MTRAEALELLNKFEFCCDFSQCTNDWECEECCEALNMAIQALEQEPKRGVWIKKEHLVPLARDAEPLDWDKYDEKTHSELEEYWHCSECDYEGDRHFRPSWDYCPNCGARMEGGEE